MTKVDLTDKRLCSKSSHTELFCRRDLPKYFAKTSEENTCTRVFLKVKLQAIDLQLYLKMTLAEMLPCGFF